MRYYILILFLTITCGKNDLKQEPSIYYNTVLKELYTIDISKYYITYEVNRKIVEKKEFKEFIKKTEYKDLKNNPTNFKLTLSKDLEEIVSKSNTDKNQKIEINYIFSHPFYLGNSTVLLFNEVNYITNNHIVGGGTRVITLKENNGEYSISGIKSLVDY